jgi:hypothetical protein
MEQVHAETGFNVKKLMVRQRKIVVLRQLAAASAS